ncbi:MAG: DUF2935 domain-containing protein [Eubacteriales bacterium]
MAEINLQRDENRFWLQIMGDKARNVLKELYPTETALVDRANGFIKTFDELQAHAEEAEDQQTLNTSAWKAVQDFRRFVLEIMRSQISEKTVIGILPEYLGV